MKRKELSEYLASFLSVQDFKDYCPNGIQVEGRDEIKSIVTGVSASAELFEKAIEKKADVIIVHHGLIWNSQRPLYQGSYKKRIKLLLENDISLFGYHLPLDAHPKIGNNALLASQLGLKNTQAFFEYNGQNIGIRGTLDSISSEDLFSKVEKLVERKPLVFSYGPKKVKTIGIVSGGAQSELPQAVSAELDAYITGEVSEWTASFAKESGIHFISAGHHATERFGVKALGDHLAEHFGINTEYIEVPNPV